MNLLLLLIGRFLVGSPPSEGFVAEFSGSVLILRQNRTPLKLSKGDQTKLVELFQGDTVKASGKNSACFVVLHGKEFYTVTQNKPLVVSSFDDRGAKKLNQLAGAGGQMGKDDEGGYERFAFFADQTPSRTGVEKLVPSSNGSLPLLWVCPALVKEVSITVRFDGTDKQLSTGWIPAQKNSIYGWSFGFEESRSLGMFLILNADERIERSVSLSIEDRKHICETNTLHWSLPRKGLLKSARDQFSRFSLSDYGSLNQALTFTENDFGGMPDLESSIAYAYWRGRPDSYVALSMMHTLSSHYGFRKLEQLLWKRLSLMSSKGLR